MNEQGLLYLPEGEPGQGIPPGPNASTAAGANTAAWPGTATGPDAVVGAHPGRTYRHFEDRSYLIPPPGELHLPAGPDPIAALVILTLCVVVLMLGAVLFLIVSTIAR